MTNSRSCETFHSVVQKTFGAVDDAANFRATSEPVIVMVRRIADAALQHKLKSGFCAISSTKLKAIDRCPGDDGGYTISWRFETLVSPEGAS